MANHARPPETANEGLLAEIAELLARGYVRLLAARESSQKCLAEPPDPEAPCDHVVNGNEDPEPQEVA